MATNEKLIADIIALATEKKIDIPVTEGLNNKQLSTVLKNMKGPAKPVGPAAASGTGDEANDEDEVVEPAKVKRPPFYICDGKSLTTLKGILGPGDEVQADYLIDGKDGLNRHRKNGIIAKG